ncbi:hypothetical protein GN958_ATG09545 [Phytophthora infestans]|uniref:Uncharacterized protein n=1 Tax=Phytophthora infestans TaxID=4787 RepID=A0A8S9UKJ9_PHYIN|nr:hypothetical protein GN958_ATG09545 [Phytophthora infestans]
MDEYTRDDNANSQEIHQVVTDIITDHAAARPSNTVKQYAPKQAEFKTWCAGKSIWMAVLSLKGN